MILGGHDDGGARKDDRRTFPRGSRLTPDKSTRYSSELHALWYEHSARTVFRRCSSNVYKYLSLTHLQSINLTLHYILLTLNCRNIPFLILTPELGLGTTPRRG
ncbi:hypothetical protein Tco_1537497 [Tanacetum coccineum]